MGDLTPDDKAIIADQLKSVIAADRFQLSPRIKSLKAVLAKLESPPPPKAVYPPLNGRGDCPLNGQRSGSTSS